jgi:hypothetical protein
MRAGGGGNAGGAGALLVRAGEVLATRAAMTVVDDSGGGFWQPAGVQVISSRAQKDEVPVGGTDRGRRPPFIPWHL